MRRSNRLEIRHFAGAQRYSEQLRCPVRVAHLTDLHVGRMTPERQLMEAVEATEALAPDLVALTGDFVCHSLRYLPLLQRVVASFSAPVVAVLGNHDHHCGASAVRGALEQGGARVLDNAWTCLEIRGEHLQVVGLDDAYTGHADVERAVRGLRPDRATLGLSHIGEEADRLWAHGVPLVLSGHTHGGQLSLANDPRLTPAALAGHRYIHGLYGDRRGAGAVYVGAGIGAAVIPWRVGLRTRRELTVFELGVSPGAAIDHHQEQPPLRGRRPPGWLQRRRARKARP